MHIECIPQSGKPAILEIYCNGEAWRTIHTTIFGKNPKFPASESLDELRGHFYQLEYDLSKQFALKRLAMRNQPTSILVRTLQQRLISEPTIQRVIEELCRLGYINDREWISSYMRIQQERKSGPYAIAQKLAKKGISKEEIKIALAEFDEEDQKQAIKKLLNTRYRTRDMEDYREKQKVVASLIRKGFGFEVIRQCLHGLEERIE